MDRLKALACAALLASSLPASATLLTEWGTIALAGSAACSAPCDPLAFALGLTFGDVQGGDSVLVAESASNPADPNGHAHARAEAAGGLAIPLLKAEAFGNLAGGTIALALGAQGYTYAGASGAVAVDVHLDGSVITDGSGSGSGATGLSVFAALFRVTAGFLLSDASMPQSPLVTLLTLLTVPAISSTSIEVSTDTPIVSADRTLTIDNLADGDQFYLVAALAASAAGPNSAASAFHTLTLQFNTGGAHLVAAPVPLPASVGLFGCAAAGLVIVRRRARS